MNIGLSEVTDSCDGHQLFIQIRTNNTAEHKSEGGLNSFRIAPWNSI